MLSGDSLGANLSVIATDPAPGSRLTAGPSSVTFTFDRPIFDGTQGFTDFQIDRVGSDNQLIPLIDPNVGVEEDLDPSGTQLTVVLDQPLAAGNYQLFLSALNMLSGSDGSTTGIDSDSYLGSFNVLLPGTTLAEAVDLGRLGPNEIDSQSTLDFTANPSATQLYKFTLTPDHFWRLGAEVSAVRQGSALNPALTLFNDQGQPIKYGTLGRPGAVSDPYLFDGLTAGTYYVGISDSNNVPGLPGGYDPATGDPGTLTNTHPGGDYTLALAADPADVPIATLGFQLDRADPFDTTPTGFELQFSGSLNAIGDSIFSSLTNGVEVVDGKGSIWPVAATGYSESDARLTYIFRTQLPPGHYTIRLPDAGGLTDLAGHAPTSAGMPRGALATFNVNASHSPQSSLDFGPFFPNEVLAGMTRDTTIAPGKSATFLYTSLYSDFYWTNIEHAASTIGVQIEHDGVTVASFSSGPSSTSAGALQRLAAGEYYVHMTNTGSVAAHVTLSYTIPGFRWENVLETGLGQGPAMGLRLVAPTSTFALSAAAQPASETPVPGKAPSEPQPFFPAPSAGSNAQPVAAGTYNANGQAGFSPSTGTPATPSNSAAPVLTFGGVPVGQLQMLGGSGLNSLGEGDVAVAAASSGFGGLAGIGYGPTDRVTPNLRDPGHISNPPGRKSSAPTDGGIVFLPDADAERSPASFPIPDLMMQVNRILAGLPSAVFPDADEVPTIEQIAGEPSAAGSGVDAPVPLIEEAGFNHPIGIGLLAILLIQSRHKLNRWLSRGRSSQRSLTQSFQAYLSRGRTA